MSFIPQGYKVPATSGQFMKFQEGDNRFRILSEAVIGWEGWKNNKPFRRAGAELNIKVDEVDIDRYDKPKISHFWAFVVWNYQEKKIQVLELTQKSIQRQIENFYILEDWGDPINRYDFVIKRYKEGDMTKYSVSPLPPKETPAEAKEAFAKSDVDLNKLFDGQYPINKEEGEAENVPF